MGQTLSEPVTDKHTNAERNHRLIFASSEMQGWRISMEDACTAILQFEGDNDTSFFAVFDGHGGASVAQYAGANCHKRVYNDPEFAKGNYRAALKNGFLGIDEDIQKDPNYLYEPSGCTAVALLITKDKRLFCANAGDSRCVLSSAGVAVPLSFDHKPYNEEELTRITEAKGFVHLGRVNGNLALSRAFGDFEFKRSSHLPPERQMVTADPEITERTITEDDEFVVLACDGIWDVLSSQQVIDFVRARIAKGLKLEDICEQLLDRCLATHPGNAIGCDNMTVEIVAMTMGEDEEKWREKCKRVAIVEGQEVNPLEATDASDGEEPFPHPEDHEAEIHF